MVKFNYSITPVTTVSILLFILIFPLGMLLSPEVAVENGPIEWLQVILLACGCPIALAAFVYGIDRQATRRLFLCSIPIWLLMIGRELSWGRVFFPNGNGGFVALKQLWYGIYVYPSIMLALLYVGIFMLKIGIHKELVYRLSHSSFPAIDGLIFVVSIVLAEIAEHHAGALLGGRNVLFEELAETVAYFSLLSMTVNLGFFAVFQPTPKRFL